MSFSSSKLWLKRAAIFCTALVFCGVSATRVAAINSKASEDIDLPDAINIVLNGSLAQSGAFIESSSAVEKYQTPTHQTWSKLKDASNSVVPWRGFGLSSKAGDIVLDENLKLKSLESAKYLRQVEIDSKRLNLIESVLSVAYYIGNLDTAKLQQTEETLCSTVSDQELKLLENCIHKLCTSDIDTVLHSTQKLLSPWEKRKRKEYLADCLIKNDPIVAEIIKNVHRYNHRSNWTGITGHVVQTTLGVATFVPLATVPLAQAGLITYQSANGGAEENKLLAELYLEKTLQSRTRHLNDLAQLLIDSYESGRREGNLVLAMVSKNLMESYGDEATTRIVLDTSANHEKELAEHDKKERTVH